MGKVEVKKSRLRLTGRQVRRGGSPGRAESRPRPKTTAHIAVLRGNNVYATIILFLRLHTYREPISKMNFLWKTWNFA
jgi:hypothetical protein